ncbi:hypothetical protein [Paraburkholderia phenazinium]|uniref:hypothetical protein n=1 Tax=Paraburkholderia phenazinium TaxID=60549 RepID=UPI00142D3C8D|nr:hypothetical protein [Paraburkholderia phenazinium]
MLHGLQGSVVEMANSPHGKAGRAAARVAHLDYTALQAQLDSHFTNVRGFVLKSAPVNG